jgi:hypothetical protein
MGKIPVCPEGRLTAYFSQKLLDRINPNLYKTNWELLSYKKKLHKTNKKISLPRRRRGRDIFPLIFSCILKYS